jgi:hypothetical protein
METLEAWLERRGDALAAAFEGRRETICERVAERLAAAYPSLCYDPTRPDAETFQQLAFRNTPIRFHRLVQTALRFRLPAIFQREYAWARPIMYRHGVREEHMVAQIRWYFEEIRAAVSMSEGDALYLSLLEEAAVRAAMAPWPEPRASRSRTRGRHHNNGR